MTAVAPYDSAEKRFELVRAASHLLHEQGFYRTTLADVAGRAAIPLGNVYYYFRTKEALAEAVVHGHVSALEAHLAGFVVAHVDPRKRLRALVLGPLGYVDLVVRFGCPHGSLCQELDKLSSDSPLARAAARLLGVYIEWANTQFRALGFAPRDARSRAQDLVGSIQGAMLIAHTMRSRATLERQLHRLERSLAASLTSRSKRSLS